MPIPHESVHPESSFPAVPAAGKELRLTDCLSFSIAPDPVYVIQSGVQIPFSHRVSLADSTQRRDSNMSYTKPTLAILGSLYSVIKHTGAKGHAGILESATWRINPAYDLDD